MEKQDLFAKQWLNFNVFGLEKAGQLHLTGLDPFGSEADVKPISMSGMSAALLFVFPAFASAQDPTSDSFRELETKYVFGFTFGSDIGPEGERELELTTKVDFQKRTGSYIALGQEAELEYNPTDSFQIELGAAGVYHAISGVEGLDDFHGANFGGLSSTFRYLLIARGPGIADRSPDRGRAGMVGCR